jgi:hypothetical protein
MHAPERLTDHATLSREDDALLARLDRISTDIKEGRARTDSWEEVLAELERDCGPPRLPRCAACEAD